MLLADAHPGDVWEPRAERARGPRVSAGSSSVANRRPTPTPMPHVLGPDSGHRLEKLATGHRLVHPGIPTARRAAPSTGGRAIGWLAMHVVVGLAPLALCFTEVMPGRGFLVDLSVALGFVALSVLGLQFALAARFSRAAAPFGIDAVLNYHRQISFLAVLAAFGHPFLLFLAKDKYRALLDVVHDPLRAQCAWLSVLALVILMITSIWRRALRLSYPVWHVLHSVLGVVIVLAALGHAFLVDYYLSEPWVRLTWAAYGAAFLWLAVWVRIVKPVRLWRRPFRVVELWPEPGNSVTVGLEPAYRHGGQQFSFQAGQFAWLLPGRTPFRPTFHPFSMSSSADRSRVEFTIKQVGGFTNSVRRLKVGDTVYVDGPHGSFTLERNPGMGFAFIAAGVGVTPFLSMLSTLADRGDRRPITLILGNSRADQITGIRQLARLKGRLNLTVVHVVSKPSSQWRGERGRIDAAVLDRHLPVERRVLQYFICAREEMVVSVTASLESLGVPGDRIHSEQFGMV